MKTKSSISTLIVMFFLSISGLLKGEFIGISTDNFMPYHRAQEQPFWCWAASAEMVLANQGINVSQVQIVSAVKGMPFNATANFPEMVRSVNRVFKDQNEKRVVVSGQIVLGVPVSNVLYNQLKKKRPVILCYMTSMFSGHAVVVTGADAEVSPNGVTINKLHLFDPYCYRNGFRPILLPNGMMTGFQPGLEYDASLKTATCELWSPDGVNLDMKGRGRITAMILIEGSRDED